MEAVIEVKQLAELQRRHILWMPKITGLRTFSSDELHLPCLDL